MRSPGVVLSAAILVAALVGLGCAANHAGISSENVAGSGRAGFAVFVNDDYHVILLSPAGRRVEVGRGVRKWRNDVPGNMVSVAGTTQLNIADMEWGTWRVGVEPDAAKPLITVQAVASKCSATSNADSVDTGCVYWWKVKFTAAPTESCSATCEFSERQRLAK